MHPHTESNAEDRYSRQIRFARIGRQGQAMLQDSRVAIVGMGALGSVLGQHLVRAGIGCVRLIDRDVIEWSNLQRQMLYTEQDAMELLPKAEAAARRLRAINSTVKIEPYTADLTPANAEELLDGAQLILDGSDNFTVRSLINDYSVKHGVPWVYGGAVGASGMTMTFRPGVTACYRCLFPDSPAPGTTDTCETAGVISPIIDIIASIQAAEAIKLLSGNEAALHGTLFQVDLWNHSWLPIDMSHAKRADCPACVRRQLHYLEQHTAETVAVALCGRESVHLTPGTQAELDLSLLSGKLSAAGSVTANAFLLKVAMPGEMTFVLFRDGRAIVQGTEDLAKARSIYAELLGV
ncbi:ThiF family adenylyltransferase [Paenibacillus soyae]|uniref:ThiF family adenylyltransferase n=1 Tax=Paenibacillus soyae TaxID=2969249 RepID=A0A9X2MPC6_9BACL|nr:ThiF family adenylyltransferase [Paenibacillus soyae]MCR2804356.1 ThiF family adenylyltransferase [Paenibacillus soyae]